MAKGKKPDAKPDIFADFEDILSPNAPANASQAAPSTPEASVKTDSTSTTKPTPTETDDGSDPLADLEQLAKSRPLTPGNQAGRKSEDRTNIQSRKSGESSRAFHTGVSIVEDDPLEPMTGAASKPAPAASSWWGSLTTAASAAVAQASTLATQLQQNEEAQRLLGSVRGNINNLDVGAGIGALRGLSDEIRSRAMPSLTGILNTIAPPISSHERLQIHITHDMVGFPNLDPLVYSTFSRVMSQVEGGDLIVIQRGTEAGPRRDSNERGYRGGSTAGWNDGPWWRDTASKRDLGAVNGLKEGSKLARVQAESHANELFASKGGIEEVRIKVQNQVFDENNPNPTRSSDTFLAIQAISYPEPEELFASASSSTPSAEAPKPVSTELIAFAVYMHDPIHLISIGTVSQSLPLDWSNWLCNKGNASSSDGAADHLQGLPESISAIIEAGGIDPREWVADWVEESISLAVGVVAQRYVAQRMGVGSANIETLESARHASASVDHGAGEAARGM